MIAAASPAEGPQVLVQLSDCHLLADPAGRLRDIDVLANLHAVTAQIQQDGWRAQAILATGDIAHDGSQQAYGHFQQALAPLKTQVRVLPGNRDDGATMHDTLGTWCDPILDLGRHWRVVMLDSTVRAARHGRLSGQQFALLDQAVAEAGDRHILVAMHHNPVVDIGPVPDPAMLENARIMLTHLTAWRQARVLVWGHTHRAYDCRVDNMRLLAAPATSFQYAVADGRYVVDAVAAGYRWLKLYDDGSISTGVSRVA